MSSPEDSHPGLGPSSELPASEAHAEQPVPYPSRHIRRLGTVAAVCVGLVIAVDMGEVAQSDGWSNTAPTVIVNFAGDNALQYRQCPGDPTELNSELKDTAPPIPPQGCVDKVISVSALGQYYVAPDQLTIPGDASYPPVRENLAEQGWNWQRQIFDSVFP
jgi:hypothetical protein